MFHDKPVTAAKISPNRNVSLCVLCLTFNSYDFNYDSCYHRTSNSATSVVFFISYVQGDELIKHI